MTEREIAICEAVAEHPAAPKTIGLVYEGFGHWRIWTKYDADDPTVESVPYIIAAEHERLMAGRDAEIARLREALQAQSVIQRFGAESAAAIRAMKGERG